MEEAIKQSINNFNLVREIYGAAHLAHWWNAFRSHPERHAKDTKCNKNVITRFVVIIWFLRFWKENDRAELICDRFSSVRQKLCLALKSFSVASVAYNIHFLWLRNNVIERFNGFYSFAMSSINSTRKDKLLLKHIKLEWIHSTHHVYQLW